MNLQTNEIAAAPGRDALPGPAFVKIEPDQSFAAFLDADRLKKKNEEIRAALLVSQQKPQEAKNNTNMAFIHKHGFRAYTIEIQERRISEMQEKIFKPAGLDEKRLGELQPKTRMPIEKAIDDEIKKYIAETPVISGKKNAQEIGPTGDPSQQLISQTVSNNLNFCTGVAASFELAFGGAQEATDVESARRKEENTG